MLIKSPYATTKSSKKKKADDCANFQFRMKDYVSRDKTKN
jgi:hypothetical protein